MQIQRPLGSVVPMHYPSRCPPESQHRSKQQQGVFWCRAEGCSVIRCCHNSADAAHRWDCNEQPGRTSLQTSTHLGIVFQIFSLIVFKLICSMHSWRRFFYTSALTCKPFLLTLKLQQSSPSLSDRCLLISPAQPARMYSTQQHCSRTCASAICRASQVARPRRQAWTRRRLQVTLATRTGKSSLTSPQAVFGLGGPPMIRAVRRALLIALPCGLHRWKKARLSERTLPSESDSMWGCRQPR